MKKVLMLIGMAVTFMNCEEDSLHELNVNPKEASSINAEPLFTYGQFGIAKQITDASYNNNVDRYWANYLTGTTYINETNYDAVNRDIGGSIFDNLYTESLLELKTAKEIVEAEEVTAALEPVKNNKLACITIMEVYAYQYLVDNFGYIPYTNALDIQNTQPSYDTDVSVYAAITADLEEALSSIDVNEGAFDPGADILYGSNMAAWEKFGYSLLLKIGMRQAEANAAEADRLVDLAMSGGVFTSNADNALYQFSDAAPYWNPMYDYFVIDSRNTDFVATQFFIDMLESRNDPRIAEYLDQNMGADTYVGGVYGANGQTYGSLTHVNPEISDDPQFPGVLLDYSTVSFMLAEAVERGFTTGSADTFYENGIRASFDSWGLSTAEADAYLAQPSVAYATAAGSFQEKIGIQKYLALYNQGHEAWTEARRLDYPQLLPGAATGNPNPKRMIYPVEEKLINPNYADAAAAMNNDGLDGAIFWDVD